MVLVSAAFVTSNPATPLPHQPTSTESPQNFDDVAVSVFDTSADENGRLHHNIEAPETNQSQTVNYRLMLTLLLNSLKQQDENLRKARIIKEDNPTQKHWG